MSGITVIKKRRLLQMINDLKVFYEGELDACSRSPEPSYFKEHINYLSKSILHCDDLIEEFSGNVQVIV